MSLNRGNPSAQDLRRRHAKRVKDVLNRSRYKQWLEHKICARMECEILRGVQLKVAEERKVIGVDVGGVDRTVLAIGRMIG